MKTDLYDDRAKSEHIRFWSDFTTPHENLWRSPPRSIPLWLGRMDRVRSIDNRGKPKIRQACVTAVVNKNVWLAADH